MGTTCNDILEQRTNGDTKRVAGIIVVREQPDGTHRVLALLPGKEVADDSGETRYEFYRNWDIPKGHGKGGEPAMTIAMREAGEEAGYTTDNLDFRWGTQSKAVTGKKGKTGAFFVAHSDIDPILRRNPENGMLEHGGFKWVTWNDMLGNVGGFWFGDAIKWARDLVDPPASDELGEGLLRTWVREILAEAPRRGKLCSSISGLAFRTSMENMRGDHPALFIFSTVNASGTLLRNVGWAGSANAANWMSSIAC